MGQKRSQAFFPNLSAVTNHMMNPYLVRWQCSSITIVAQQHEK